MLESFEVISVENMHNLKEHVKNLWTKILSLAAKKIHLQLLHLYDKLYFCEFVSMWLRRITFTTNGLARSRHRIFCEFKEVDTCALNEETLCNEFKFNYTCKLSLKGLLDRSRVGATREGDVLRSSMLLKHDFPQFVTKKHTYYSLLTF